MLSENLPLGEVDDSLTVSVPRSIQSCLKILSPLRTKTPSMLSLFSVILAQLPAMKDAESTMISNFGGMNSIERYGLLVSSTNSRELNDASKTLSEFSTLSEISQPQLDQMCSAIPYRNF